MDITGRRFMLITPGSQRVNSLMKSIHVHLCISCYSNFQMSKMFQIAQVMAKLAHQMLKTQFPQVPLDIDSRRDRDCRSEGTGQGLM